MTRLFALGCAVAALACACGGSQEPLRRTILDADFAQLAQLAAKDPGAAKNAAALLTEHRLRSCVGPPCDPASLVSSLASGGRVGRSSLEALAKDAPEPVQSLALIALTRGKTVPRGYEALLRHDASVVREAFAAAFSSSLTEPDLLALATDVSPAVRRSALSALSFRPASPASVAAMRQALRGDPSPFVQGQAARATAHLGEDALVQLTAAIDDPSEALSLSAIDALAGLGTDEAFTVLERLALDQASVRGRQATTALCRAGKAEACQRAVDALFDPAPATRAAALLALVSLASSDSARAEVGARAPWAVGSAIAAADEGQDPWLVDALLLLTRCLEQAPAPADAEIEMKASAAELEARLLALAEADEGTRFEIYMLLSRSGRSEFETKAAPLLTSQVDEPLLLARLRQTRFASSLWAPLALLLGDEREEVRLAAAAALLAF